MKSRPFPHRLRVLRNGLLVAFSISHAAHAATGTWNVDSNGLWSTETNWASNTIADGSTSTANFTNDITADRSVSLDSPRVLNRIIFGDADTGTAAGWLIDNATNPANILTLGGSSPRITVGSLGSGKTAEISPVLAGSVRIAKDGIGTLVLSGANTYSVGMEVTGGVVIMNNADADVGGTLTSLGGITVNNTSAFRQSAGKITVNGGNASSSTGGTNVLNIGSVTYGAYELSGGTLQVDDPWRLNPRRSQFTQSGGDFNVNYTGTGNIADGRQFMIGSGNDRGAYLATAGNLTITTSDTLTANVPALIISDTNTSSYANGAEMTLSGTAEVTLSGGAGSVMMTRTSSKTGFLNLNGGRLTTNSIGNTQGGVARLSIDGGTLRAQVDTTNFLEGLTSARIYSGGATIDTNGKNITIAQSLESPLGDGLASVAVTSGGSGYVGAPIVRVTGGGGTGATAVANFDAATETVTGITITSPGSGYTSAPTVTLDHGFQTGGTTAVLGTVTLSALTSGGLTKNGNGTLTLSGSSTYTGATTVNQGALAVTGSLDATDVEVKNNATLAGDGLLGGNVIVRTGGHQAFEIADTAGSQTPMEINGSLTLEADTIIDLTAAVPPAPGGPYVLLTAYGGITGTPASVTLTGLSGSVVKNGNNLELTVTAPVGFADWINTNYPDLADKTAAGDPDNDGITNLMEYVLNGNPGASSTNILPAADNSDPADLIFTFTRREESAADTTQVFQYGTDLSAWTDIAITGTPGVEVTLGTPAGGLQLVTVKVPKSAASPSGKLFGRLQVTQP